MKNTKSKRAVRSTGYYCVGAALGGIMRLCLAILFILALGEVSRASTLVMLLAPGDGTNTAGDTAVYVSGATDYLLIDTTVILTATNYLAHAWLGDLYNKGLLQFSSSAMPLNRIEIKPTPDHSDPKDSGALRVAIPTFTPLTKAFVAISCRFRQYPTAGSSKTDIYMMIVTDIRNGKAVAAFPYFLASGWSGFDYDGMSIPLVIPSDATEEPLIKRTPDLNGDGVITSPDLLLFHSLWHDRSEER